jgi:protein involved in polysaccharide export with SLBB domain
MSAVPRFLFLTILVGLVAALGAGAAPTPGAAPAAAVVTPLLAPPGAAPAPLFDPEATYEALPRFGSGFFAQAGTATGAAQTGAPPPAGYQLGAGDALSLAVWAKGWEEVNQTVSVSAEGTVVLPEVGNVPAAGQTLEQLRATLTALYSKLYQDPTVTLLVPEQRTIEVFVTGDATRPGRYALPGMATVLTALYACGGPSPVGSFRSVVLRRAGQALVNLDLYDYLLGGSRDHDLPLLPGDVLFIAPAGPEVAVGGEVRRPGRYEMAGLTTVAQALQLAGGLQPSAYLPEADLWRAAGGSEWTLTTVSLARQDAQNAGRPLSAGDLLLVKPLLADGVNAALVQGAVKRPGLYPVGPDSRVADLIAAAQGPAGDAHMGQAVLRRRDAERHYAITTFDLSQALAGDPAANLAVQPHDTIEIYRQEEVEPAFEVTVQGAVVRPGQYEWAAAMRLSDLLRGAGGLTPGAYPERAALLRLTADRNYETSAVDLTGLADKPGSDLVLQRGDILQVRLRSEVVPVTKVRIDGYVTKPGEYDRPEQMRVSDLIFAAGGLAPGAGPTLQLARGGFETTPDTETLQVEITPGGFTVTPDEVLQPGDAVGVAGRGEYKAQAELVRLEGAVHAPGSYVLRRPSDVHGYTVRDLLQEGGGLLPDANINGVVIYRHYNDSLQPAQTEDLGRVLQFVNAETRQPAMQLTAEDQTAALGTTVGTGLQSVLSGSHSVSIVLPPRAVAAGDRVAAIPVDGPGVLSGRPRGANLELEPGDIVVVPRRVNLVTVLGAVPRPGSVPYVEGHNAQAYLNSSGGFREDAATNRMIVVHANGAVNPLALGDVPQAGDVIVVPTKYVVRTVQTDSSFAGWLRTIVPAIAAALVF